MVSYIVKGKSVAARSALAGLRQDEIGCISAITEGEIRYGLAGIRPQVCADRRSRAFWQSCRFCPGEAPKPSLTGSASHSRKPRGRMLETLDILIAAHAIAVDAVLVTDDRAFGQVQELVGMLNWATDILYLCGSF